jgi:IS4 transposase
MQNAVREIVVRIKTGKTPQLLTNDLDSPAQEIADLYKRRWQIELFFRVLRQTLKITKFIGRSETAARIQSAVALIAFLLLCQLQAITQENHGFPELVRVVRANLTHRKAASRLRQTVPPPLLDSHQLELQRQTT